MLMDKTFYLKMVEHNLALLERMEIIFNLKSIQDGDITFHGDDGGSAITALQLDMSASGADTFNDQVTIGSGSNLVNAGNMTIDVGGDLTLDADGADIRFADGGTIYGNLANESGHFAIKAVAQDTDISFKVMMGAVQLLHLLLICQTLVQ